MTALLLAALAAATPPLGLTVDVAPTSPRAERHPLEPATPVPIVVGPQPTLDGVLDEPLWQRARPAPPLIPFLDGPAAPELDLRFALADGELFLAVEAGDVERLDVLVDPRGTHQRWVVAHLEGDHVSAERCGHVDERSTGVRYVPPQALPCVDVDVDGVRNGSTWEISWSREVLGELTTRAGVLVVAHGPGAGGGTWSRWGVRVAIPPHMRQLKLGVPLAQAQTRVDNDRSVWVTELRPVGLDGPIPWTWRMLSSGAVLAEGSVNTSGDAVTLETPAEPATWLEILGPLRPDGLRVAAVSRVPTQDLRAHLATPVARDEIVVAWHATSPVTADVSVRSPRGRLLGVGQASLPAGAGLLRVAVEDHWPDELLLDAEPFLSAVPIVLCR